jgi:hypothetical protein
VTPDQQAHDVRAALPGGQMQRGLALEVTLLGVRPFSKEQSGDVEVPVASGPVQRVAWSLSWAMTSAPRRRAFLAPAWSPSRAALSGSASSLDMMTSVSRSIRPPPASCRE